MGVAKRRMCERKMSVVRKGECKGVETGNVEKWWEVYIACES